MAAYHEAVGFCSLVLALSLLELIASGPPSRPRFGTIHGELQQIATTSTASGEGLTLHNDFDFASLEGLESLKVDNIKPQKIASSSPMATVRSFSFSDPQKRYLPPAEGAR